MSILRIGLFIILFIVTTEKGAIRGELTTGPVELGAVRGFLSTEASEEEEVFLIDGMTREYKKGNWILKRTSDVMGQGFGRLDDTGLLSVQISS